MGSGAGLSNTGSGLITFVTASGIKGKDISIAHGGSGTATGVRLGGTIQALGLWDTLTDPNNPTLTTAGVLDVAANNGSITSQPQGVQLRGSHGGTTVIRTRDDITVSGTWGLNTVSGSGLLGEMKMLAGRSVLVNGPVSSNNSPITIKANYSESTDSISDTRLPGNAVITTANTSGVTLLAGTGAVDIRIMNGSGLTATDASAITSGAITLQSNTSLTGGNVTIINDGQTLGTSNISSAANIAAKGNVLIQANTGNVSIAGITTDGSVTSGAAVSLLAMDDITNATRAIENSSVNGNVTLQAGRSITSSNHINSTNGGAITIRANNPYDISTGVSASRSTGTAVITISGDVGSANNTAFGPVDISIGNGANLANNTSGTLSLFCKEKPVNLMACKCKK
jgi:filamentous hemagglutinin